MLLFPLPLLPFTTALFPLDLCFSFIDHRKAIVTYLTTVARAMNSELVDGFGLVAFLAYSIVACMLRLISYVSETFRADVCPVHPTDSNRCYTNRSALPHFVDVVHSSRHRFGMLVSLRLLCWYPFVDSSTPLVDVAVPVLLHQPS